jgi:hypothetical protein
MKEEEEKMVEALKLPEASKNEERELSREERGEEERSLRKGDKRRILEEKEEKEKEIRERFFLKE